MPAIRNICQLDLDRLHRVITAQAAGRHLGPGAGATTALLVEAAQQVDFLPVGTEVAILAGSHQDREKMENELLRIARGLDITGRRRGRRGHRVDLLGVRYRFFTRHAPPPGTILLFTDERPADGP